MKQPTIHGEHHEYWIQKSKGFRNAEAIKLELFVMHCSTWKMSLVHKRDINKKH